MKYPPIFVAGCVRSGTSLTASLLLKHGVFIGNARTTSCPGSNIDIGTERIEFKPIIQALMDLNGYNKRRQAPIPKDSKTIEGLREKVLKLYPKDKPFLIKASGLLWFTDVFNAAFPEAIWLMPWRPLGDTVDSILRHPKMKRSTPDRGQLMKYVQAMHMRQQNTKFNDDFIAYPFSTQNAVMRNLHGFLPTVLRHVGIDFDRRIFDAMIDQTMWHSEASC